MPSERIKTSALSVLAGIETIAHNEMLERGEYLSEDVIDADLAASGAIIDAPVSGAVVIDAPVSGAVEREGYYDPDDAGDYLDDDFEESCGDPNCEVCEDVDLTV